MDYSTQHDWKPTHNANAELARLRGEIEAAWRAYSEACDARYPQQVQGDGPLPDLGALIARANQLEAEYHRVSQEVNADLTKVQEVI